MWLSTTIRLTTMDILPSQRLIGRAQWMNRIVVLQKLRALAQLAQARIRPGCGVPVRGYSGLPNRSARNVRVGHVRPIAVVPLRNERWLWRLRQQAKIHPEDAVFLSQRSHRTATLIAKHHAREVHLHTNVDSMRRRVRHVS